MADRNQRISSPKACDPPRVEVRASQARQSEAGVPAPQPVIHVENLYKSFGDNPILEDISLEVYPGERLSIVGSSGCGKTVLAKHFNGLLAPDSGRVTVYGKDLSEAAQEELEGIRRRIGYIFQGNALFASAISADVYDNVSLLLRPDPYDSPAGNESEIEARVAEILEQVGLGREFFGRTPSELSGGQKKRVAIARAIAPNPPIIIYDEPTTGQDPEYAGIIIDLIDSIYQASGNTTIAITHERKLMRRLGRVIFLKDRRVYFDGNYEDFLVSKDPTIARFLAKGEDAPPDIKPLKQPA